MPELSDHDPERRFGSLYQEHYRSIQAYAVRRVEPRADVADVVADVFTIAWRRIAQVPPPPGDRLWLYGVARRVIAGRHRSSRRQRRLAEAIAAASGRAGSGSAPGEPARQRLAAGLARLRPADREALALVLWEGLSHAEAGQVILQVRGRPRGPGRQPAGRPPGHAVQRGRR